MTNEELRQRLQDLAAESGKLGESEDDLDAIKVECAEYDQIAQAAMEEEEQWEYGHGEGILDAIESLMSFRENIRTNVLLRAIHKIAKRKLFDPPF